MIATAATASSVGHAMCMIGHSESSDRHQPVSGPVGRAGMALVLLAIPVTSAAGPYLLPINFAGLNLYAFRLLVAIVLPVLLLFVAGRIPLTRPARRFFAAIYVWIA